jgi:LEA14-like dessication related protein
VKNIFWVALIAAGFWVLTKYRASQSLTYRPIGVNFDGANLILTLGITNQSSFPISFTSFNGTVSANGVPLGGIADYQPAVIAAGAETQLQLVLVPNLANIANLVKNIFTQQSAQQINLDGMLVAENINLPVNTSFATVPAII